MDVLLVGLNHTTAPVEIRERLALSEKAIPELLPELHSRIAAKETLLLSTCNRTEVLAVPSGETPPDGKMVLKALADLMRVDFAPTDSVIYEYHGEDAVRHVLRVAAGLDSMVLGEPQILGQVRQAYAAASQAETTGLYVNKILHSALAVGKRVRTETDLGYGALSVGNVAVLLACKVFGDLKAHSGLVVGAGEMAQAAAMHLREQGIRQLCFVNRTYDKAAALAAQFDGEALAFDDLYRALEGADIVISSTGAPGYILTHEMFHKVMSRRHTRPIFLADIAVPRDIDPEINDHENAFLYDIDSLRQVVDQNLARRRQAIPDAEAIVEQMVESYRRWKAGLVVKPVVQMLYERFENTRKCEVGKYGKNFREKEAEDLEKLTRLIQNKILHHPMEVLKKYDPDSEEGQRALALICEMFDLK